MMAERPTSRPSITWTSDDTFVLAGTEYLSDPYGLRRASEPVRFCLAKGHRIIDRYEQFLTEFAPRTIVEVGILEGASTALLADLARPEKLVAIDRLPAPTDKLRRFIERRGYEHTVSIYGGVDQADGARLASIVDHELGGRDVDLVVDDASHLLGPTRATFNSLFPRLRTGGIYLLEDWATGLRVGGPQPLASGERPLVDLVVECVTAKGRHPTLIGDVTVRGGWALIERGTDPVDGTFDIAERSA
jgi:predicted O-methyltransferase YrrM